MVLDTDENTEETAQLITTLYTCPVEKCNRSYRTVQGLQHHIKHLKAHDHHGPGTPATPQPTSTPKNKKNKHRSKLVKVKAQTPAVYVPEPLTFEEAQKMVQLEVNGIVVRIGINDCLNVVASNSSTTIPDDDLDATETRQQTILSTPKLIPPDSTTLTQSLPEASFRRLPDYCISDAPPRANAYIRFIEKSAEELDGEVEYDVDEEDSAWLSIVNKRREAAGLAPVAVDSLELLMDRFEKESYFQATQVEDSGAIGSDNSHHRPISMDDDAVCCICMDGECQNTNVILFCDMCNLAVHQDCYGVPYIPEGQWLCRRCLQSPSRAVSCVLCPNQGGAFKQTDRGDWAHVVCALWIPEVRFANTVFLEPVDSVEAVPAARWRLTCVLCRQRGVGACIQCHRASCYAAFHVTCAQHYGLYMRMQTVTHSDVSKVQVGLLTQAGVNQPVLVQKIAYCEQHSPPDYQIVKTKPSNVPHSNRKQHKSISKSGNAAKRLNNHQSGVGEVGASGAPVILLPTIPPERIQEIGALVQIQKKSQFIQRLIAYWMLKRQFRNGVPLLRRLQSSAAGAGTCGGGHRGGGGISGGSGVGGSSVDTNELYQQLKYWQCLRQDLERARLLCELVRKREKLKAELIRSTERCLNVQLRPLQSSLLNIISLLSARDTNDIFGEPVDPEEVPDYTSVVTEPMDFSTMKTKCERGQYEDLTALEKDFELMISNCLKYNSKDTVFYRAGVRMREQGRSLLKLAREELEKAGLLKDGLKNEFTEETKCEKDVKKKSVGVKEPSKKSKLMSHDGFVADKLPDKNRKVPEKSPSLNDDSNKSVATSSAPSSTYRVTSIGDPSEVDKCLLHLQEKRAATTNLGPILKDLELLLIQSQCLKHGLARAKRVKLVRNEIVKVKRLHKDIVEQAKKNKEAVECKKQDKHTQKKKDVKDKDKPTEILDNDNNARGQIAENLLKKEPVTKSQSEQSNANSSTTAKSSPTAPTTSGTGGDALESATSAQGVNRRTAVLFTRKALHQSAGTITTANAFAASSSKKSKGKSIDEKMGKEENAPKEKGVKDDEDPVIKKALQQQSRGAKRGASRSDSTRSTASSIETPTKKPRRTTNTNVNTAAECAAVGTSTVSVQSTRVVTGCSTVSADAARAVAALGVPAGSKVVAAAAATMPDSFRVYRDSGSRKTKGERVRGGRKCRDGGSGRRGVATRQITPEGLLSTDDDDDDDEDFDDDLMTDDDENSDDDACSSDCSSSVSTCYSHTLSEIEDISNTPAGTAQPTLNKSSKSSTHKRSSSATSPQSKSTHALKPLQLVWAKCRGYPWYPALIIDPDTPPGGVVHRGVPLPGPPADVVALRANVAANNAGKSLYLILFFDAKRTWQWLPADKLEVMDLDGDEAKTNEPRKPADRKAVKRAYEHAFRYMKQVTAGKNKDRAEDEGPSPSPAAAASGIAAILTVDVNKHTQADGKASSKSSAPAT